MDRFVYFLAPFLTMTLAISAIAWFPFGPAARSAFSAQTTPLVIANVNVGLLVIFAITSMGVYGVALAGWSSNSKYSLLGGLRSSAQMVSYELSLTLSVVGVLLLAGTLQPERDHHARRAASAGASCRNGTCSARRLPQVLGFFCYFVSADGGDQSRCRSTWPKRNPRLVAGFHTEYSSFKFAMFFLGEYASMITVACLATILFFGGWLSPFPQTASL